MAWTAPRTWAAAEKPTATQLNQQIVDNFAMVPTDIDWTPLALESSWALWNPGQDWPPPRACRRGGMVFMQGMIGGGSLTPGAVITRLPVDLRPFGNLHVPVPLTATYAILNIQSDGVVLVNSNPMGGANSWMGINLCWAVV